jgi:hypothetical protein
MESNDRAPYRHWHTVCAACGKVTWHPSFRRCVYIWPKASTKGDLYPVTLQLTDFDNRQFGC